MKPISINNVEYVDGLVLSLLFSDGSKRTIDFSDFFEKHPHLQYNKYKRKSEFKKFWLRNGNLIWGKHADLNFPLNALYYGNLELCCDDEWPEALRLNRKFVPNEISVEKRSNLSFLFVPLQPNTYIRSS